MGEVVVRTATERDVPEMVDAWADAIPHLVRSADALRGMLAVDEEFGRLRTVAVVDDEIAGTAVSFLRAADAGVVQVGVRPRLSRRGAGSALLTRAMSHLAESGATVVTGVANGNDGSTEFARRHGFQLGRSATVSGIDPRSVAAPAEDVPGHLYAVRCDEVPDLTALLDTHNACAHDDPSGHSLTYTEHEFRTLWWNTADHAPHHSWAVLDGDRVAGFSSVLVDPGRGRAWSAMTATLPAYRNLGLATWLKRRVLSDLAAAGVTAAYTANDSTNTAMLAVNAALGYRPVATQYNVRRDLGPLREQTHQDDVEDLHADEEDENRKDQRA